MRFVTEDGKSFTTAEEAEKHEKTIEEEKVKKEELKKEKDTRTKEINDLIKKFVEDYGTLPTVNVESDYCTFDIGKEPLSMFKWFF